ncbi:MAG: LPXTG cell wall anchor domain-containing protein [Turneriella sp.]
MEIFLAIGAFLAVVVILLILRRRKKDHMYVTRDRQIQAFPPGYRSKKD